MNIIFYIKHLYYLPQYLPVYNALLERHQDCTLLFEQGSLDSDVIHKSVDHNDYCSVIVDNSDAALQYIIESSADWVFFGESWNAIDQLPSSIKTALLYHGIGVKSSYYDSSLNTMSIRFVESQFRKNELNRLHGALPLEVTGFAKLDPLFKNNIMNNKLKNNNGSLDPNKKTLLYAPTFYPSSIERMKKDWPNDFKEFNIIIKPHFFSLTSKKYKKHQQRIQHWSQYPNVFLVPIEQASILPYLQQADLLISDASSAIFEFAALNKPIVWCDFLKLRWSYRGVFKYRFKRRMDTSMQPYFDIAKHVSSYKEFKSAVVEQLQHPMRYEKKRLQYSAELLGACDGLAADRVADYIIKC